MKTSIVIPCRNESEVIGEVVRQVKASLNGYTAEVIVVAHLCTDDTAEVALKAGARVTKCTDPHLADAMLCGFKYSKGDNVIWMDGDGQHPPETLPQVIEALERSELVVASRNVPGGSYKGFTTYRRIVSGVANLLALPLTPHIKDRTAGFFGIRRSVLDITTKLNLVGYKFPLEVFVKGNYKTSEEVPFTFRERMGGTSKLSKRVMTAYIKQLIPLYLHKFRWLRFGLVGLVGAAISYPLLYVLTEYAGLYYIVSAICAIVVGSTSNYFLNNRWTFTEKRRHGLKGHIRGWLNYQVLSAMGDGAYLGLLAFFTEVVGIWYMASALLCLGITFVFKWLFANKVIWRGKNVQAS